MNEKRDVIRIEVGSSDSSIAGSSRSEVVEFPRAEWDAMTEGQREEMLDSWRQTEIDDRFEAWATVVDEEED